jgi:hypothetical protein
MGDARVLFAPKGGAGAWGMPRLPISLRGGVISLKPACTRVLSNFT